MQDITLGVYYPMRPRETGIRALTETCDAFPGGLVRANLRAVVSLKTGIKTLQEAGSIL